MATRHDTSDAEDEQLNTVTTLFGTFSYRQCTDRLFPENNDAKTRSNVAQFFFPPNQMLH